MSQNVQSRLLLSNANLHAQRSDNRHNSGISRTSNNSHSAHSKHNEHSRPQSRPHSKSKRNSISSEDYHYQSFQPQVKLENTYSLGPNTQQRFSQSRVTEVVTQILNDCLKDTKYESSKCKKLVKEISEEIKKNVKPIVYMRYKIVVSLAIGQNLPNESMIMASRALWNTDTDNECTVNYRNESLYAVATIFAVYFDWSIFFGW